MKNVVAIILSVIMMICVANVVFAEEADAATGNITLAQAKNIAFRDAKAPVAKIRIMKARYDREDRVYEIKFAAPRNVSRYEYEISTRGVIIEKSVDYTYRRNYSRKKISVQSAANKVAAAAKVSTSVVRRGYCKFERDDGQGQYEVAFIYGNYRYEYEVIAADGRIISYEKKYRYRY